MLKWPPQPATIWRPPSSPRGRSPPFPGSTAWTRIDGVPNREEETRTGLAPPPQTWVPFVFSPSVPVSTWRAKTVGGPLDRSPSEAPHRWTSLSIRKGWIHDTGEGLIGISPGESLTTRQLWPAVASGSSGEKTAGTTGARARLFGRIHFVLKTRPVLDGGHRRGAFTNPRHSSARRNQRRNANPKRLWSITTQ